MQYLKVRLEPADYLGSQFFKLMSDVVDILPTYLAIVAYTSIISREKIGKSITGRRATCIIFILQNGSSSKLFKNNLITSSDL